jgi:hypothetical protein
VADAGHRFQKAAEAFGVGIERDEGAGIAAAGLVLRLAGTQRGREVSPEVVEAVVRHLENAPDIGWLAAIEEQIGGGRVGVDAVAAFEEVERDQSIEEVACPTRMQAEASAQLGQRLGVPGKLSEDPNLDGAQEGLGGKETHAYLHNSIWPRFAHC